MKKFLLKFCLAFALSVPVHFIQAMTTPMQGDVPILQIGKALPGMTRSQAPERKDVKKTVLPPVKRPGSKNIPDTGKPHAGDPSVPLFRPAGGNTVLCGALVYSDEWANPAAEITAGIYTWAAQSGSEPEMVHKDAKMMNARAAVKVGNRYYMIRVIQDTYVYYNIYDATTWKQISEEEIDINSVASDLTLDPVSNKVYGIFYNEYAGSYNYFGTLNLITGLPQVIAEVPEMFVLAADKNGVIYGISYNGRLYTIDKTSAAVREIGKTGEWPMYVQSATFDPATNKLYWAANLDDGKGVLYEVDTKTAKLTEISAPSYNPGFAGLYALPYTAPREAPETVTDIQVDFTPAGSLTGSVSFVLPGQTIGGDPLTGTLSALISLNGTELPEITGLAPGARYTSESVTFTSGMQEIAVTVSAGNISGEAAAYQVWAGTDTPGPVTGLILSKTPDGNALLNWEAPVAGQHNGYLDPGTLTYRIVRLPDLATVCESTALTTFTDTTIGNALASYSYRVTGISGAGAGEPAESNSLLFGQAFQIPYVETFDTKEALSLWTIINANGGTTWGFYDDNKNGRATYTYDPKLPGDDWLISPPVRLEGGKAYKLSYFARNEATNYQENFKVTLGNSNTPDTHTTVLAEHKNYDNSRGDTFTKTVSIQNDGDYYIGFYAFSETNQWRLHIDDIRLEPFEASLPDSVTSLTAEAAPLGALSVTVSFVTPTVSFDGKPLTELTKIDIFRNKETTPVKTFPSPATGTALSWTDMQPVNGINTYRVIASGEGGSGIEASVSVFVGPDIPGPVTNLKLKDVNGSAVITWEAPQTGANGGYFDPTGMGYRIVRVDGVRMEDYFTGTTYTDNSVSKTDQVFIYYVVTPYIGETKGIYNTTNEIIFGKPYPAPFHESFANADLQNYPWISETFSYMDESWTLEPNGYSPDAAPQDKDGGLASFHAYGQQPGSSARFYSPKINISSLNHPKLTFWFFHYTDPQQTGDDKMQVEISVNGDEYQAVPDGLIYRESTENSGWKYYSFPLDRYKENAAYIQLGFLATSGQGMNLHLDNISIEDGYETDLEAVTLAGPARIAAGEKALYTLYVKNKGVSAVTAYTASLYKNGEVTATLPGIAVQPGETVSLHFEQPLQPDQAGSRSIYKGAIECARDENEGNNITPEITTSVITPLLPLPGILSGEANDNNIELRWTEPVTSGLVSEDIENFRDFAISDLGEWTLVDRDGARTVGMGTDDITTYDNKYDPKAFQVLNPGEIGLSELIEPHSGNKLLMSIAANGARNDDWLISPCLNGAAQTVRFFARSFIDSYGLERMRILYSTTDTDPDHFIPTDDAPYLEVPAEWTEYTAALPEGTKYFGVNCVSDDAFALFLDDFSYNDLTVSSRPNRTGYRIYRDGTPLTDVSAEQIAYTDTALQPGTYLYKITGLYDLGESAPSNEISQTVILSGIDEISGQTILIETKPGEIIVTGADGCTVRLCTSHGSTIASRTGTEKTVFTVSPGLYLLTIDNRTRKIVVP